MQDATQLSESQTKLVNGLAFSRVKNTVEQGQGGQGLLEFFMHLDKNHPELQLAPGAPSSVFAPSSDALCC